MFAKAERAEVAALQVMQAEMTFRIFNDGKAADGSDIGTYRSDSHKRIRRNRGRQTSYKDLELDGDLRRSIVRGTSSGQNVIGFTDDKNRTIAEHQETPAQTGKVIFTPTDQEIENSLTVYAEVINE